MIKPWSQVDMDKSEIVQYSEDMRVIACGKAEEIGLQRQIRLNPLAIENNVVFNGGAYVTI
jgi:hypothetical protein